LFCVTALPIFKNRIKVPANIRKRVDEAIPRLAIVDKKNMVISLIVLGVMFAGFFLHNVLHLEPGIIALGGSMILMVLCGAESNDTLMEVEWGVIFFFIGLFMMVSALESTGVITWIAKHLLRAGGHNLLLMCIVVLWASAILSSVLDNIPFVMAMIPVLKMSFVPLAQSMNITDPAAIKLMISQPLWWSLALGACLGGNGTLIGASANVVSVRICNKNKYHIRFTKYGFLFMLESLVVCTIYIWLRYF
jgi:Na+/H+ antiporter NhaD/arsenite permease-like protein